MLATAGTVGYMHCFLNYPNTQFIYTSVISAPEGVSKVQSLEPMTEPLIITARLDDSLDYKGYIVPGMGDFGDKWYYNLDLESYFETLVDVGIINQYEKDLLIKRAA